MRGFCATFFLMGGFFSCGGPFETCSPYGGFFLLCGGLFGLFGEPFEACLPSHPLPRKFSAGAHRAMHMSTPYLLFLHTFALAFKTEDRPCKSKCYFCRILSGCQKIFTLFLPSSDEIRRDVCVLSNNLKIF